MVKQIATKTELDQIIATCGNTLLVIDFTATWCGPCQRIGPIFTSMENKYPNVKFVKVDVDQNAESAEAFGITAMPTFLFMKNGKKVMEFSGADEQKLQASIQQWM